MFYFYGLTCGIWKCQARGKLELQLPNYTTAIETWDLSHICDLHHSSEQCQILNPLSSRVFNPPSHNRNSLSIFITISLNYLTNKLFILNSIGFFIGFYVVLSFEHIPLSFCFVWLPLSLWDEVKQLPIPLLKVCPYMGTFPCVCPVVWRESWSSWDTGHVFSLSVLAVTPSVGGRARVRRAKPEPGTSWGFSQAQWKSMLLGGA